MTSDSQERCAELPEILIQRLPSGSLWIRASGEALHASVTIYPGVSKGAIEYVVSVLRRELLKEIGEV